MGNDRLDYLMNQTQKNSKKLEYDFMPGLVEIIEKPTNKGALIVIWVSLLMIITASVWAYCSKVEVVEECKGVVMSAKGIVSVVSQETGLVEKVYVKEDTVVNKGDKLVDVTDMEGKKVTIYSEQEGIVANLIDFQVGLVLKENQEICKLLPKDNEYKIMVNLPNSSIADVDVKNHVNVKIDAYSYGDYGMFDGTVTKISKVAELSEMEGYYFPAEIKVDKYDKKKIELMDGMTCTVDICVGKRRILEYVLEPIVAALKKSVKEK